MKPAAVSLYLLLSSEELHCIPSVPVVSQVFLIMSKQEGGRLIGSAKTEGVEAHDDVERQRGTESEDAVRAVRGHSVLPGAI